MLSAAAILIFIPSGVGNLMALRRTHRGAFLILGAALATAADWATRTDLQP